MIGAEGSSLAQPAPTVSIIIPTHRPGPYLSEALQSVREQKVTNWEVIVVDDGWPDPSALCEVVAAQDDCRMRVVRGEQGGAARARNTGIGHARGEYLAFLDSDDYWYPNYLSVTLEALAKNVRAAGSFGASDQIAGDARTPLPPLRMIGPTTKRTVYAGGNRPRMVNLLTRRETVLKVGGFDPDLRLAQDIDFILKLALEGEFIYVDELISCYRIHDGNSSGNPRRTATFGDRVLRNHLHAAIERGDKEAADDLRVAARLARDHYADSALRDAWGRLKAGDARSAFGLFGWGVRRSPSSAARLMIAGPVRRARRAIKSRP